MRTLDRYIIRETLPPFLLSLLLLTFLLAILPMLVVAQDFLSKGVPLPTVGFLLVTLLPQALGLTIPMSFLIGLLMAFGRLSADREVVALLACGVSLKRLLRPVLVMAVVASGATGYVMIELIPDANQKFSEIRFSLLEQITSQDIRARLFFTAFPGKVLYIQDIDSAGAWRNVLVGDTHQVGRPSLTLAARGQLILDRNTKTAVVELFDLVRYAPGPNPGEYVTSPSAHAAFTVDPAAVFQKAVVAPDLRSMTIAELQQSRLEKRQAGLNDHLEIIDIQQKFSFPVACWVMALMGLSLGVHTRREGKFAGFTLGLSVILVYYALMMVFEGLTKGLMFPAVWARWVPNLVLGPAGIALLWWQSRSADHSVSLGLPAGVVRWQERRAARRKTGTGRVVLVVRLPRLYLPRPRLLDLYLCSRYLRVVSLCSIGLLALFYVSTVIQLSDHLFKKDAPTAVLLDYLWYSTPQYVYWIVPLATLVSCLVTIGALTKSSELTIMRACGVSLYRTVAPLLLLAMVWSGGLFLLEERVMPQANKRAQVLDDQIRERKPAGNLDDRHWLAGHDDRIYYYTTLDTHHQQMNDLSLFEFAADGFRLDHHLYAERVTAQRGSDWLARTGWTQTFPKTGALSRRQNFQNLSLTLEPIRAFTADQVDPDVMSYADLRKEVARRAASGFTVAESAVQLQGKLAFPLATLVMTLIGIPFAVTHGRRGALYGIGVGIGLALTYRLAVVFFAAVGSAGLLSPVLAAWAPNLLFVAGATTFLLTVRT